MTDPLAADRLARLPGPTRSRADLDRVHRIPGSPRPPGGRLRDGVIPTSGAAAPAPARGWFEIASSPSCGRWSISAPPSPALYSNPVKPAAHVAEAWRAGWRPPSTASRTGQWPWSTPPARSVYARLALAGRHTACARVVGVANRAADLLRSAARAGPPARGRLPRGCRCSPPRPGQGAATGRRLRASWRRTGSASTGSTSRGRPARYADAEPPPLAQFGAAIRGIAAHLPYRPALRSARPGAGGRAGHGSPIGLAERPGGAGFTSTSPFNGFMEAWRRQPVALPGDRLARAGAANTGQLTGPTATARTRSCSTCRLVDLAVDTGYFGTAGAYTTSHERFQRLRRTEDSRCGRTCCAYPANAVQPRVGPSAGMANAPVIGPTRKSTMPSPTWASGWGRWCSSALAAARAATSPEDVKPDSGTPGPRGGDRRDGGGWPGSAGQADRLPWLLLVLAGSPGPPATSTGRSCSPMPTRSRCRPRRTSATSRSTRWPRWA
jgi:ornithine decarboxylase